MWTKLSNPAMHAQMHTHTFTNSLSCTHMQTHIHFYNCTHKNTLARCHMATYVVPSHNTHNALVTGTLHAAVMAPPKFDCRNEIIRIASVCLCLHYGTPIPPCSCGTNTGRTPWSRHGRDLVMTLNADDS